jgi:hypothetical protein
MNAVCPTPRRPLVTWLARGLAGVALVALALWAQMLWIIAPALGLAFIAFGGCPMCWTYGFAERVSRKLRKDAA